MALLDMLVTSYKLRTHGRTDRHGTNKPPRVGGSKKWWKYKNTFDTDGRTDGRTDGSGLITTLPPLT